ncbi:hypothetical protein COCNU_09G008350 [Cocos nucifera]|uniref:Uncharacterized protein n=1 Tax=Cocos nucifera TaxID=13894 RepID=A0A8K0IKA5_COCNU|nr:hypothetical protein COCNU_09G008350 [Cocos nucifera]
MNNHSKFTCQDHFIKQVASCGQENHKCKRSDQRFGGFQGLSNIASDRNKRWKLGLPWIKLTKRSGVLLQRLYQPKTQPPWLVMGAHGREAVNKRVAQIRNLIENMKKEKLNGRMAKPSGGVAVIQVH